MQNCQLTITDGEWTLSPPTDPDLCNEVRLSGSLAEALKKIESRGWKVERGKVDFKREGLPERLGRT